MKPARAPSSTRQDEFSYLPVQPITLTHTSCGGIAKTASKLELRYRRLDTARDRSQETHVKAFIELFDGARSAHLSQTCETRRLELLHYRKTIDDVPGFNDQPIVIEAMQIPEGGLDAAAGRRHTHNRGRMDRARRAPSHHPLSLG